MAEYGLSKRLALDANVPLDLAAGLDLAHDFCENFQARGYHLLLAPTAAEEIWLIHQNSSHPKRKLATKALRDLTRWGIDLLELKSHLQPVAKSIGRAFAQRLIRAGHLPPEETNDGIIVAETALAEIPVLVTRDRHLLNIEEVDLLVCLQAADLPPVKPVHPRLLWRAIR
jgi:predicted nucleic acid-binding protein